MPEPKGGVIGGGGGVIGGGGGLSLVVLFLFPFVLRCFAFLFCVALRFCFEERGPTITLVPEPKANTSHHGAMMLTCFKTILNNLGVFCPLDVLCIACLLCDWSPW